jgi:hypothetical protein
VTQPRVAVQDAGGNTLTALNAGTVTLAISAPNTPDAVLGCSSTLTVAVANGVAPFLGCNMDKVGTGYTLTATRAAVTDAVSTALAITPGAATHLVFTTPPTADVTSTVVWPIQPTVTVEDAAGNAVTTNVAPMTLSIPAGATLACTTNPETPAEGAATWDGCNVTGPAATYTVTAGNGTFTVTAPVNIT